MKKAFSQIPGRDYEKIINKASAFDIQIKQKKLAKKIERRKECFGKFSPSHSPLNIQIQIKLHIVDENRFDPKENFLLLSAVCQMIMSIETC